MSGFNLARVLMQEKLLFDIELERQYQLMEYGNKIKDLISEFLLNQSCSDITVSIINSIHSLDGAQFQLIEGTLNVFVPSPNILYPELFDKCSNTIEYGLNLDVKAHFNNKLN